MHNIESIDPSQDPIPLRQYKTVEEFFTYLKEPKLQVEFYQEHLGGWKKELENIIPWYMSQFPLQYHWLVSEEVKTQHIIELFSTHNLTQQQFVERVDTTKKFAILASPGEEGNKSWLAIPPRISRHNCKLALFFKSQNDKVTLGTLLNSEYDTESLRSSTVVSNKKTVFERALEDKPKLEVRQFLECLDGQVVEHLTVPMVRCAFEAIQYCQANELSYVNTSSMGEEAPGSTIRCDLGLKGFPLNAAIENVIGILVRYGFLIDRVIGFEVRNAFNDNFSVVQFVARTEPTKSFKSASKEWGRVVKGLKTLSFVDHRDEFSALLQGPNPKSLNEANLARAMANWTHIFLTKSNPHYFTLDRVNRYLVSNENVLDALIRFFRAKFDPRFDGNRQVAMTEESRQITQLTQEIADDVERSVLKECFNFVQHILKTNYFLVSKGGLAFRLDPNVLSSKDYPDTPYGIFYMIGRDFRAFQVRYRDIARGGVRIVMPRTNADYDNSLAGLFDEVNGLASAQQMKNKDIPEGGSKCVVVVRPGGNRHLAAKAMVTGLLDLITVNPKTNALADGIIDYLGKEEIIYLGPDENMTDDLIVWTIEHALHRGYKYAYAFMSSKPDFGINHKTYGVTSEGLNVYVDHVLKHLKLDSPDATFTVKMTGGPDGDVAGNELKILHNQHGEKCRVLAIADGFGCAFDPNGLQWKELLRLVRESKSIVEFNKAQLSGDQRAFVLASDTTENIRVRDNLYAKVEADIFIPAGGRPYTVKENNWKNYLKADGTPSSKAIVEGANIYFTPGARQKLVESGVVIIKDSSANKAGVICSSFEIIACLTISKQEFAEIKPVYVQEVIEILKSKAGNEGRLLFSEWKKRSHETDLVKLSYEISQEINQVKDIMSAKLAKLTDKELESEKFNYILLQHCPKILVEKYRDRILTRIPKAHKAAIISAYVASYLVYKEGLNWLESYAPDDVFKIAFEYMEAERAVDRMVLDISASNLPNKEKVLAILKSSGAKYLASH